MITDLSYLESMAGGDKTFIREMIDIFREQIEEYSQLMPELLKKSKYSDLSKLAHKAKSSVSVMGMIQEANMLKELELLAKDEIDIDSYPGYIERFITNSKEALKELEATYKT